MFYLQLGSSSIVAYRKLGSLSIVFYNHLSSPSFVFYSNAGPYSAYASARGHENKNKFAVILIL